MLELVSIPAIVCCVYWIIELIKYTTGYSEKFKRFIPITAAILGGILGVGCFYLLPDIIPASNVLIAIVLGISSGLCSVGFNQIIKQVTKESIDGK